MDKAETSEANPASGATFATEDRLALGERELRAGQHGVAAMRFSQVLEGEPSSEQRIAALRGLARARRNLGDFASAVRAYATLLDDKNPLTSQERALYWLERGACESELLEWTAASESFRNAISNGDELTLSTEIEIRARLALALFQSEQLDESERVLLASVARLESVDATARERLSDPYFLAMTHFYLGAISHRRFLAISLHLPQSTMERELREKAELLERAQGHYNNAIRTRHVYWVSAAGFQLGSLFESFYDSMMQSPVPPELSPKQRAIFYSELKKQIRPVVTRAIWVFEQNLTAAQKLGYRTPFVEETEKRLVLLQRYLLSEDASGPFAPPPLASLDARHVEDDPSVEPNAFRGLPEFLAVPTPL